MVGGKLTTHRRTAEDAAAEARACPRAPAAPLRCPLVGAAGPERLRTLPVPRRLIRRYGTEAVAVHALATQGPALAEPALAGHPVTRAELLWAVRHEGAPEASDLLDRRTRIGRLVPQDRDAVLEAAREVLAQATAHH